MTEPVSAAVAASAAVATASPGLLAGFAGFFAGILLTWPALIVLVLFGVIAEHNSARGWAVFWAAAALIAGFFYFDFSLLALAISAVVYVAVGVVWSWYRYKRFVSDTVAANRNTSDSNKQRVIEQLHPKAMLGTITAWIMIWPMSFLGNVVGDLIDGIQLLVTKVFRGIYHKIYNTAVEQLLSK
jgi:hypothetical protein